MYQGRIVYFCPSFIVSHDFEVGSNDPTDRVLSMVVYHVDVAAAAVGADVVEDDGQDHFSRFHMRRRSKLPMPKVESDVSVWSLLCKNIGKDLSKISMPVSMNEPLNALQVSQQHLHSFPLCRFLSAP